MPAVDLLAERIARRQASAVARGRGLLAAVPALSAALRERGATRVVLFGSLVSGAPLHESSDVDLCVTGLPLADAERAELELSSSTVPVHVVRWESASPELRAIVTRYGRVLHDDA